jgi:energy-coupling factor transporter ATP-binding protein EcfA2
MKITEPVTLISLEAENVKTLRAVRVAPESGKPVFTIGGVNGAGKSTLIDCLRMSIMGGREIPDDPIRHGQRHAHVKTVLGRNGEAVLTIELDMAVASKPRLVVRNAEGAPQSGPQGILNELYEHVAFDPLEFSRFDKEKRAEIIMRLAGLDFKDQDARIAKATELRKLANAKLKEADTKFKSMPEHRGVPAEETSVKDVLQKLSTARTHNEARKTAAAAIGTAKARATGADNLVAELEEELKAAKAAAVTRGAELKTAEEAFAALAPPQDVEAFEKQAETVEDTNRKVRENAARAAIEATIREQEVIAAGHDKSITEAQAEKKAAVAAAKFPIPELSYDLNLGLLLNDAPLEQASDGQKLRLSVAIAIALNPMLNIMLIKQGNLLDAAGRKMIEEMAQAAGALVLMEMVSETGAGCSVFIEDGELRETAASAAE